MFSKYCPILVFFHVVLSLWWGGGGGGFLVITVSHPTFCCVGVGVVVELGLGCDNSYRSFDLMLQFLYEHTTKQTWPHSNS